MAPKPVSKHVICSDCGLSWDAHVKPKSQRGTGEPRITSEDCVRVLKAELNLRPPRFQFSNASSSSVANSPTWVNFPS